MSKVRVEVGEPTEAAAKVGVRLLAMITRDGTDKLCELHDDEWRQTALAGGPGGYELLGENLSRPPGEPVSGDDLKLLEECREARARHGRSSYVVVKH